MHASIYITDLTFMTHQSVNLARIMNSNMQLLHICILCQYIDRHKILNIFCMYIRKYVCLALKLRMYTYAHTDYITYVQKRTHCQITFAGFILCKSANTKFCPISYPTTQNNSLLTNLAVISPNRVKYLFQTRSLTLCRICMYVCTSVLHKFFHSIFTIQLNQFPP